MNWELLVAGGSTLAVVVLAFLYAKAAGTAAQVASVRKVNETLLSASKVQRSVIVEKEDYIRELERSVLGNLPAGELAARLSRLFEANRRRASGSLPASERGPKSP